MACPKIVVHLLLVILFGIQIATGIIMYQNSTASATVQAEGKLMMAFGSAGALLSLISYFTSLMRKSITPVPRLISIIGQALLPLFLIGVLVWTGFFLIKPNYARSTDTEKSAFKEGVLLSSFSGTALVLTFVGIFVD